MLGKDVRRIAQHADRDHADRRNAELSAQLRQAQAPKGARNALGWAAKLRAEGLLFREDAKLGELWPELCAGRCFPGATERVAGLPSGRSACSAPKLVTPFASS